MSNNTLLPAHIILVGVLEEGARAMIEFEEMIDNAFDIQLTEKIIEANDPVEGVFKAVTIASFACVVLSKMHISLEKTDDNESDLVWTKRRLTEIKDKLLEKLDLKEMLDNPLLDAIYSTITALDAR